MLVDTHAHVNFSAYKDDAGEVIRRSLAGSTSSPQVWMINVGSQYDTSKKAVEMAEGYPEGVYAAIGLHPIHTNEEEFDYEKYKELIRSPKVVAVGEIGLDYKPEYISFKQKQKEVFLSQLDLARELSLPVIFHCRMAHEDLIKEIRSRNEIGSPKITGAIHCFTGDWEQAQKYLDMGFYFGLNGIIFKLDLDAVINKIPLDRILLETDCPYLTPAPMTGRNEPLYVKYVADKVAKLKNLSYEEIENITTQNAKKLFNI